MRLPDRLPVIVLVLLVAAPAAGNLWETLLRTAIPRRLDDTVAARHVLREKHPGIDDVYLLQLTTGRRIHVEKTLFNAVVPGDTLEKPRWSREVRINGKPFDLDLSPDSVGMAWAMPVCLAVAIVLAMMACRRGNAP